jgi:DNA invertase Pin-like site-specific DNA recombinase
MIYGYCRVSTKQQSKDGYSLEVQEKEILSRYETAKIELEQYTGSTTVRPVFSEMIENMNSGDTLVVTKLDRLARNTVEGISIVQTLFDKGVSVHVLNVGLLENTSMGKFFLTTLLAVAEMERNTIIERTHAGKEMAKTKDGFVDGRPKLYTKTQLDLALGLLKDNSYNKVAEMVKISKSTIIREVRRRKADWAKSKTKYEKESEQK